MSNFPSLFPHFQPIICVASGAIVGFEALARYIDAQGKIASAQSFLNNPDINFQERVELDRQIRRQALQQFAAHSQNGYLAINICATSINDLRQIQTTPTLRMLDELNIDKRRVIIEITEAEANTDKLQAIAKRYRKLGLRVALDDFGAGSSQLERVIAIKPDVIKLDMRLFKDAAKGGIEGEIVNMLTRLGQRTGCEIICEGVENEDEFMFGLQCGAQFMQGHLFAAASAEFNNPNVHKQHITSLRSKFLRHTTHKALEHIRKSEQLKNLIFKLAAALQQDFNLNELAGWNFAQSGIMRFYLCDDQGYQSSPDFNFAADRWFSDPRYIGFNWSWRPYFFQLQALEQAGQRNRIVTSEQYLDFSSQQLIKTYSLRLDADRILMVDCLDQD
jgi:EAL domain-containing protein (putative c-di-GMP-specific phosphodiesterase class I)